MVLHFAKYEGAGNDFVVVDARGFEFEPQPELVAALCDDVSASVPTVCGRSDSPRKPTLK